MSEIPHGLPELRRLVVALGGKAHDEAALQLAARLAQRVNAELSGLFLEDAELIDVFSLPVSALVVHSGRRKLDMLSLERGFRVEARRLRHLVATVSERHTVRWSFHVRRVRSCEDVARPLGPNELLVIATQGHAERRRRLGEALGCEVRPAILILEPLHRRAGGHIAVLYEGERSVLTAGAHLAGALEAAISVIPVRNGEGAPPDDARLREWSDRLSVPAGIAGPVHADAGQLRAALDHFNPDVVVIGREGQVSGFSIDALDEILGPRAVLIPGSGGETAR